MAGLMVRGRPLESIDVPDTAPCGAVAALARIRLEEGRSPSQASHGILGWIEHSGVATRAWSDGRRPAPRACGDADARGLVDDGGQAGKVLANAPDREGEYFGVPKVVE